MKTLRNLINENSLSSIASKNTTDFFETEIKGYELFSKSELKSYLDSVKFQQDLFGCLAEFYTVRSEDISPILILKISNDRITLFLEI